jgi:hypothetical protein
MSSDLTGHWPQCIQAQPRGRFPPSFNRSLRCRRARVLALSARDVFESPQRVDVTVET